MNALIRYFDRTVTRKLQLMTNKALRSAYC